GATREPDQYTAGHEIHVGQLDDVVAGGQVAEHVQPLTVGRGRGHGGAHVAGGEQADGDARDPVLAGVARAVVVGVVKHLVAEAQRPGRPRRDAPEVEGEIGVRVAVPVRDRLAAGGQGDYPAADRAAGPERAVQGPVVVVVHVVVRVGRDGRARAEPDERAARLEVRGGGRPRLVPRP